MVRVPERTSTQSNHWESCECYVHWRRSTVYRSSRHVYCSVHLFKINIVIQENWFDNKNNIKNIKYIQTGLYLYTMITKIGTPNYISCNSTKRLLILNKVAVRQSCSNCTLNSSNDISLSLCSNCPPFAATQA